MRKVKSSMSHLHKIVGRTSLFTLVDYCKRFFPFDFDFDGPRMAQRRDKGPSELLIM